MTTRPARKLDSKKLGPFPIKRAVGTHAYELEFPPDIKIHPVQPVLLLSPVARDPLPGQIVPPPPPVVVDGEEPEYHVEAVRGLATLLRNSPVPGTLGWLAEYDMGAVVFC